MNAPCCPRAASSASAWCPIVRSVAASWPASGPRAEEYPEGDYRRSHPRLQEGNFDSNLRLLEKLEGVATRARATPGQVALAWLLTQGPDIVPIFGTTRRTRLRENLAATGVQLASCDQFLLRPGLCAG